MTKVFVEQPLALPSLLKSRYINTNICYVLLNTTHLKLNFKFSFQQIILSPQIVGKIGGFGLLVKLHREGLQSTGLPNLA